MSTTRVVGQAKRFAREIADGTKRARGFAKQAKLEVLRCELETMLPRVRQVIKQARARLKLVKLQEAENQIVTDYEVCAVRPNDANLGDPLPPNPRRAAGLGTGNWRDCH